MPNSRPKSVAIEFDTFRNSGYDVENGVSIPVFDPNGNHVGIDLNGAAQSVATATTPGYVALNGNPWNVWVDYNGSAKLLEVRMSQGTTRPATTALFYTVDLSQILSQRPTRPATRLRGP